MGHNLVLGSHGKCFFPTVFLVSYLVALNTWENDSQIDVAACFFFQMAGLFR